MPNSTRSGKNRKSAFSIWVRALQAVTGPWTKHNLFSWVGILFVVFFIKGCIVDQYTIPTGSMEPTLIGNPRFFRGDRVLVNKCLFGPRIPFTTKRLWHWGNPERWDIVVFHAIAPDAKHPILVKRVVGLPGEKIHIRDGKIWINGEVVTPPEPLVDVLHYTDAVTIDTSEIKRQFLLLAQRNQPLPGLDPYNFNVQLLYTEMEKIHSTILGKNIDTMNTAELESLCDSVNPAVFRLLEKLYTAMGPEMKYGVSEEAKYSIVPDDHYLMLGDNSKHSLDGRMYGWVPHNNLYGRTFAVWWPWSHRKDFTGFSLTWWGKCLMYGIPTVLIGLEAFFALRRKS